MRSSPVVPKVEPVMKSYAGIILTFQTIRSRTRVEASTKRYILLLDSFKRLAEFWPLEYCE